MRMWRNGRRARFRYVWATVWVQVPPSAPKKCLTKYPRIQDDMWKLSRLKLKNAQALLSKFRSKLEAKTKCEITEKIV